MHLKISTGFFVDTDNLVLQLIWKCEELEERKYRKQAGSSRGWGSGGEIEKERKKE